ncbi:hypothetical protein TWF506_004636 [Arthrobotrys conoides]|uniref:F-box domain-containing protein n=1 Tax=Arthrobotrys conoides TaxID=74498 RepID=A0AAN8N685_9PEZI
MLLQKEGNGLFAALPTEICHFVLEYMDKQSRDAFARCSRHCYSIAFPARFIGIKFSEVDHRYWLKVFTQGWLAPLGRWVHTVVLDIADIKYITVLPLKLTVFPNLRGLKFNIHGPKPFEGNVFNTLSTSLSTLPFYNNITYLSINWYAYQIIFDNRDIIFVGEAFGPAQLEQEIRKEEKTRDHYDRDIELFPEVKKILGPHLSKVEIIERTLNGDIHFPKKLQSLELGMGSQSPYYLTPMLNCSTITTLIFDFFPSKFRDSKGLSESLQFPAVKTIFFSHVGIYAETGMIANHFPNVEFIAVTRFCTMYWAEFIKSLPQVKTFTLPWYKIRYRYALLEFLERGIKKLLNEGHIPQHPTISFSGNYEVEGEEGADGSSTKYISLTCRILPNTSGSWDLNWEGDTDYKLEDMELPEYQEEALKNSRYDRVYDEDYASSEEDIDDGSVHSEYMDSGSDEGRFEDGEEEGEADSDDSEYWQSGDEVEDGSDGDDEMDLEG